MSTIAVPERAASSAADAIARPRVPTLLIAAAVLLMISGQVVGITTSSPDRDMGHLQKIMYVHVPAAWASFIAFFVVFWASVTVLWKRSEQADLLNAAAAEAGAVMTGLTLVLGSIWGRPTWGVWWTWDARLTSTAVLFLVFVGFLALRALTDDPERRARWSAAVGILGALNVPIVYMSVKWWRTLHQMQSSPSTVDPAYVIGLRWNAVAFAVLLAACIVVRYRAALWTLAAERRAEARALSGGSARAR
ncbi:MAG: cytochrome c biogenesis protein CcsA [Gemmatimonadaceae bacterium]|nr:cytochrome c biogenesis protein CcsA [Gemmatimonadaceae bacterium]